MKDVQQDVDALAGDGAADVEQFGPRHRPEQSRRGSIRRWVGPWRARRVYAVVDDLRPLLRYEVQRHEVPPGGLTPACHDVGPSQPLQHAPDEPSRQPGLAGAVVDQGAERVGVVARDHHASAGQRVDQVRVAVVDEMKHVGATGLGAQPARVVVKAVDDAIDRQRPAVDPCQPSHPSPEGRPQQDRFDRLGVLAKVGDQHVRHQVHARPALLEQVSNHANAQGRIRCHVVTDPETAAADRRATVVSTVSSRPASMS